MSKLSDIGEFGLIKNFSKQFLENLPKNVTGIGDDCSIVPLNNTESQLVTTDMLIEDIHFIKENISAKELGYKSLAVNLSDIAAMGGTPQWAHLSLGLPVSTEVKWIKDFFSGVSDLAEKYNVKLLGGDTTKSPDKIAINFTISGKCRNEEIKKRSSAQTGDIICVTDYLGNSAAGLQTFLKNTPTNNDIQYLQNKHNKPEPHIFEGRFLAKSPGTNAMMDISDGIGSDIKHILNASGCGAEIQIDKLPLSDPLSNITKEFKWDIINLALSKGEDYILLVTINKDQFEKIATEFQNKFEKPLYNIGQITDQKDQLIFKNKNQIIDKISHGFDHFK